MECCANAPVVELVDTTDSKSVALWACLFESGRGHQRLFAQRNASNIEIGKLAAVVARNELQKR